MRRMVTIANITPLNHQLQRYGRFFKTLKLNAATRNVTRDRKMLDWKEAAIWSEETNVDWPAENQVLAVLHKIAAVAQTIEFD